MKYKYKFSVIMPIYNVELYLEEAIKSIINQTIGFKENIQLILINDGSLDNCEEICLKYEKLYPDNVIYKKQENKGVSVARNEGIKLIKGKYTNFFDSDDIWEKDAFEKVYKMFEENEKEIDVLACRQKYFEKKKTYQALDFKFEDGNQIVDINEKPNYLQMSVASAFFKSCILKNYSFDPKLKYAEDGKFLTEIIMEKQKYGLLKDAMYYIRKRENETSATQNKLKLLTSYTDIVENYYKFLYDYSMKKFKKLHPYIEYALINSLKYRVVAQIPENIPEKTKDKYIKDIISLVKKVSDEAIINTGKLTLDTRLYILSIKNGEIKDDITYSEGKIYYKEKVVGDLNNKKSLFVKNISIKGNKCNIKGILKTSLYTDINRLYVDLVGKKYFISLKENLDEVKFSFDGTKLNKAYDFEVNIDLNKNYSRMMFYILYNDELIKLDTNFDNVKVIFEKKNCYKNVNLTKDKKIEIRNFNIQFLLKKIKRAIKKLTKIIKK